MKFKMIPVKNQKFEIGRTVDPTKCDCKECNFMNCPKNNYCLKMTQKKYTVKEFFNENKEDMLKYASLYKWFKSDNIDPDMPINYFTGCTNVQEKIQKRLEQLENLFMENRKNED